MLRQCFHALAFGQILPDQPVGVFIGASFPGMVRGGEVELHSALFFDLPVAVELGAVVGCYRFDSAAVSRRSAPDSTALAAALRLWRAPLAQSAGCAGCGAAAPGCAPAPDAPGSLRRAASGCAPTPATACCGAAPAAR